MLAAYFNMRCFADVTAERPDYCVSFIVYGASEEEVGRAGNNYLNRYQQGYAPNSKRVHTTGPQFISTLLKSTGKDDSIDWPEIARKVEAQEPARVQSNASCTFKRMESVSYGTKEISLDGLSAELQAKIKNASSPLSADLLKEIERELDVDLKIAQNFPVEDVNEPLFIFLGSAHNDERCEREGELLLIEAATLDHAADMLSVYFGWVSKTMELTEWCCPVFPDGL